MEFPLEIPSSRDRLPWILPHHGSTLIRTLQGPAGPAWDLSFVLFSLVKPPFEPVSEIPLKLLTLKTVFLTLLASGATRGERHAIAYSTVTHALNWTNIVLHLVPGFISKTQLRTSGASSLERITIPSIGHTLGRDLAEDRHLSSERSEAF